MIGRLQRVPLREVWKHEAYDFTHWLSENIEVLSEALDLTLLNPESEKKTESAFSVDLMAETESGDTVIIENQLEKSDHDHLGKLITYLTAMQARAAVWIVSDPRPEHVAAIAWLNEGTSGDFYLLKVEALRIEESPPAPLLTVIVGPTEEAKNVGDIKHQLSERGRVRKEWWKALVAHPEARHHRHITPSTTTWIGLGAGLSGVSFNYVATNKTCGVEVYIDRGKERSDENLAIFDALHASRDVIEQEFAGSLSWQRLEGKRACRIRASFEGGYGSPEDSWALIHDQMTDAMNRLVSAIKPHLNRVKETGIEGLAATEEDEGLLT